MIRIVKYLKILIAIIIAVTSFNVYAFDTIELETRVGTEYVYNGIVYLLNNGEARVCGSVKEVEHITIPSKVIYKGKPYIVTSIDDCAFDANYLVGVINGSINKTLKSVTLPNTIREIGSYVFNGCNNLEKINIPNSVQFIGIGVFFDCQKLQSINIPEGIKEIKECTFDQCYSLKSVTIPFSVNEVGQYAFCNCRNLKNVKILNSNTKIYETTFTGCEDINLGNWNGEVLPRFPKCTVVVFNVNGVERRTESTSIWMLFDTKEEASKHYVGEYELGKRKETFMKRDSLIYW